MSHDGQGSRELTLISLASRALSENWTSTKRTMNTVSNAIETKIENKTTRLYRWPLTNKKSIIFTYKTNGKVVLCTRRLFFKLHISIHNSQYLHICTIYNTCIFAQFTILAYLQNSSSKSKLGRDCGDQRSDTDRCCGSEWGKIITSRQIGPEKRENHKLEICWRWTDL